MVRLNILRGGNGGLDVGVSEGLVVVGVGS